MAETRGERAQRRREQWRGEVVEAGTPKGPLYAALTPAQRLAALARLNMRAWLAAGGANPEPKPRSEWPGEIFELRRD